MFDFQAYFHGSSEVSYLAPLDASSCLVTLEAIKGLQVCRHFKDNRQFHSFLVSTNFFSTSEILCNLRCPTLNASIPLGNSSHLGFHDCFLGAKSTSDDYLHTALELANTIKGQSCIPNPETSQEIFSPYLYFKAYIRRHISLHSQFAPFLERIEIGPPTDVLTYVHGDYLVQNTIKGDDMMLQLYDWEYCGISPIYFDLGWIIAVSAFMGKSLPTSYLSAHENVYYFTFFGLLRLASRLLDISKHFENRDEHILRITCLISSLEEMKDRI